MKSENIEYKKLLNFNSQISKINRMSEIVKI
jgi:hypothetical protein